MLLCWMNGICYSFSELDFFKVILINVIGCDVHVMFIWKVDYLVILCLFIINFASYFLIINNIGFLCLITPQLVSVC